MSSFLSGSNPVPSLQAWGAGREGGGEQHHHHCQAGDPGGGRNQAGVPPSFKGTITRDFRASRCTYMCIACALMPAANVEFSVLNDNGVWCRKDCRDNLNWLASSLVSRAPGFREAQIWIPCGTEHITLTTLKTFWVRPSILVTPTRHILLDIIHCLSNCVLFNTPGLAHYWKTYLPYSEAVTFFNTKSQVQYLN